MKTQPAETCILHIAPSVILHTDLGKINLEASHRQLMGGRARAHAGAHAHTFVIYQGVITACNTYVAPGEEGPRQPITQRDEAH